MADPSFTSPSRSALALLLPALESCFVIVGFCVQFSVNLGSHATGPLNVGLFHAWWSGHVFREREVIMEPEENNV